MTLLPLQQGLLIPNTWPVALERISFDGLFNTAGATMPWFAQIKGTSALLATSLTPWDAGLACSQFKGLRGVGNELDQVGD